MLIIISIDTSFCSMSVIVDSSLNLIVLDLCISKKKSIPKLLQKRLNSIFLVDFVHFLFELRVVVG